MGKWLYFIFGAMSGILVFVLYAVQMADKPG